MSISDFNFSWEQESEVETSTTRTTDSDVNLRKRQRQEKGISGSVNTKRSFIWKFFKQERNANNVEVMKCDLLDHNGNPCTTQYLTFGSTSNAIQHLANVHGILEEGKLHVKVFFYYIFIFIIF